VCVGVRGASSGSRKPIRSDPIRSSDVHVCVMCLVSPPVGLIGGGWMGREGESCVCGLGLAVWCVS
jgi:hypothetical protein